MTLSLKDIAQLFFTLIPIPISYLNLNPIPKGQGQNQPLYDRHLTKSGRNGVKAVLSLPKRTGSAQTHKSISFI